jgi:TonB family protein
MEAMEDFHRNRLAGNERQLVEGHLQQCPFCRDAYEGLSSISDFSEHRRSLRNIRKKIQPEAPYMKIPWFRTRTVRYLAAAASVLFLAGLFSIYTFILRREPGLVAEESRPIPGAADTLMREPESDADETTITASDRREKNATDRSPEAETRPPSEEGTTTAEMESAKPGLAQDEIKREEMEVLQPTVEPIHAPEQRDDTLVSYRTIITAETEIDDARQARSPETAKRILGAVQSKTAAPAAVPNEFVASEVYDSGPQFAYGDFQDFQDYVAHQIAYPDSAVKAGISGTVLVGCDIGPEGKVRHVKIIDPVHPLLDREALRVVRESPEWIPAKRNNQPVKAFITIPVAFNLDSILLEKK